MLATTQRMTTTGPRSGGSRFFALPPCAWHRAPRSHDTRPAHRSASQKPASGFLRSAPAPHARQVAAQAADERPACTIFSYQTASGYTVAPNSGARSPGYEPPGLLASVGQGIAGAPQFWKDAVVNAIVDPRAPGSTIVTAIEGAGSGIWNWQEGRPGAMTLGTSQIMLSVGMVGSGVLTDNPTFVTFGAAMWGLGTTNFVGGAVYGPEFKAPISPNSGVSDWVDWTY